MGGTGWMVLAVVVCACVCGVRWVTEVITIARQEDVLVQHSPSMSHKLTMLQGQLGGRIHMATNIPAVTSSE